MNVKHENGPFKLIFDDFGPANMIVKSEQDLTIVGIVDLRWAYARPAQLFGSAPWWLLHDRPVNDEWDFNGGDPPEVSTRYFDCLKIFQEALAKEEQVFCGSQSKQLLELIKWSETSGAMYVHMLLSSGFFNPLGFPCMHLKECVGVGWWLDCVDELEARPEVKQFVADKLRGLEEYDKKVERIEKMKICLDNGQMKRDDFVMAVNICMSEGQ